MSHCDRQFTLILAITTPRNITVCDLVIYYGFMPVNRKEVATIRNQIGWHVVEAAVIATFRLPFSPVADLPTEA